jgi:hypothetical protein
MIIKTAEKGYVAGLSNVDHILFLAEDGSDYRMLETLRGVLEKKNKRESKLGLKLTLWETSFEPSIKEPFQLKIAFGKVDSSTKTKSSPQ